jgi:ornithine cyclodeaminase
MTSGGQTLVLNAAHVRALLPMRECIDVMEDTFRALGAERATAPNRTSMSVGRRDETMLVMPASVQQDGTDAWFGAKVLSIFPTNGPNGHDSIQGVIVLFGGAHGSPLALVDAGSITAIRTAAVSAVATRLLARPDSARLCILGSGVQALSHAAAMAAVLPITELRVWSRDPARCAALARTAASELGIASSAASSARDAVEHADVICTATSATTPIVLSAWIAAGAHVNAIGAHRPAERELDSDTIRRATLIVDHVPAALVEAGDVLIPIAEGCISPSHVLGGLSDLLSGHIPGRATDADVTVFKSVGIAIEDVAAAAHVYRAARASGAGTFVRLA